MHHAADLEQCIQISRHLRRRRQLPQQPVGLQVEDFFGMNQFGLSGGPGVIELNAAGGERLVLVFEEKQKYRVAGGDLVSVTQPLFFDRQAVDQSAVAAVQIFDLKAAVFVSAQQAVFSRNRGVGNRNRVRRIAAQRGFSVGQRNGRIFRRAGYHQESRAQSGVSHSVQNTYHSAGRNACPP
jgi:hypothetical protein